VERVTAGPEPGFAGAWAPSAGFAAFCLARTEGITASCAIELLHRAGVTSGARHQRTWRFLRQRERRVDSLVGRNRTGPCIACAAVLFKDIDAEIRKATEDEKSLDDVVRVLMKESRRVSPERLREVAEEIADGSLRTLRTSKVRVAVHRGE
jgi:hypothetical protein